MVLYGLGKKSLAERLNCSLEEAENIIEGLYTSFPKLREYIAKQQQYVFDRQGFINTMLSDKLRIKEYDLWKKATDKWEKNNLKARCERLAVNLPIQGGTASINKIVAYTEKSYRIKDCEQIKSGVEVKLLLTGKSKL